MQELTRGWTFEADRGPDWLFVKLHGDRKMDIVGDEIADGLWELLEQHLTYRLALELDDMAIFRSSIVGQLVLLQRRIQDHGGLLRICGLSEDCRRILRETHLDARLPQYGSREEALMGDRPSQPR